MQKTKILIIDDFEPLLEEISDFLQIEGYSTTTAEDGTVGIQMALQHNPDLIICDIEMPKMNGYEVYQYIDQIPNLSGTPFIFLTARAQPEDFRQGLRIGADDYLTKPFELDELILTINKRLKKNQRIKQAGEKKFKAVINNPLVGIFVFQNNKFILTNKKLLKLTGYSNNELNKLKLDDLLLGDKKNIINELNMCLKGIHDSIQMKVSIINKDKKALFLELFGKSIIIENKKAIIGSVVDVTNNEISSKNKNAESNELDSVIEYMISLEKEEIAKEIMNVRQLVGFNNETKFDKIKDKVKITKRELQILKLICQGFTNNEIAEKLFISRRTVDNHRASLLLKTETKNTANLVAFSISNKLVTV